MTRRPMRRPLGEALRRLDECVEKAGSARAWARSVGLSEAYVCDVRSGRKAPGAGMLLALGLVRVVSYAPAPGSQREAR
ncbi:hypothetical protein MMSR116_15820 [Methylobacterium mesophilicum SR1.6/6]|uniref:XRE family transcriptional regulator n=2 Tax=Methylobacterium mesophilicum TaxID=39956 RepID=A0A6B9FQ90_9HYPH|nr:hypothetical protein MMSR116_15820 [Methylobacterium mesophilicum SR1.6/6]